MRPPSLLHCLTWVTAFATAAATPAPPTTGPWVARAQRDLAQIQTTDPTTLPMANWLRNVDLAAAVCDADPTDDRRAMASKMIRTFAGANADKAQTRQVRTRAFLFAAAAMADVDDLPATKEMLTAADGPTTLPDLPFPTSKDTARFARAFAMIRLGDAENVPDVAPIIDCEYVGKFTDAGRQDMADQLRRLVEDAALRAPNHQPDWPMEVRMAYLIEAGLYADGSRAALAADEPGQVMEYKSIVADASCQNEERAAFRAAIVDFLGNSWTKPQPQYMSDGLKELLDDAIEIDDRQSAREIAAALEALPETSPPRMDQFPLAIAYAAIQDPAKYNQNLTAAAAITAGVEKDSAAAPFVKQAYAASLAAIYARAGDTAGVEKTLAGFRQIDDHEPPDLRDSWEQVEHQYICAGRVNEALKMARQFDPTQRSYVFADAARALARSGNFSKAIEVNSAQFPKTKITTLYFIARTQARTAKLDGLAEWIDKQPSPIDRVVLNLAVANQLSGRKNHWLDYQMRATGW